MNSAIIQLHGFQRLLWSFVVCISLVSGASAAGQSDQKQVMSRARQIYYNLRRSGLIELQSNITPNWKLLLTGVESNAATLKLLNGLHFSMSIDSESKFWMEHRADLRPSDQKQSYEVNTIFSQMDEAVSRFFATWSIFMLTSPFPENEIGTQVARVGDRYHFTHKEGPTDVLTITNQDFKVVEIKVSGADFHASLKPVLEQTSRGLVLMGYAGSYETASGARNTQLNVRLDYQEINGLQLPRRVNVKTVYVGRPAQMEWVFTDYKVKVR